MLIGCSYFTHGARHILNVSLGTLPGPEAEDANAAIVSYIAQWQRPFLIGVLGPGLGIVFDEYLARTAVPVDEYEEVAARLREPFANYVFFHILRDSGTQATMTGLVRLKCANDYVAPIRRQVSVWNDMADMIADFSMWSRTAECPFRGMVETDADFITKINTLNI